jgi:hypothetical protein
VLTVLAIGVVALVVAVASVLAARQDVREATPRPVATRSSGVGPIATDRIEFTTSSGSGVLQIVDHGWDSDGSHVDEPGSLLTLAIELTCRSGTLSYGPEAFQAFDRGGDLFDAEVLPDSPTALDFGILSAGQQVSGTVAFDIPRGGVTLLMSDESSRTVTALKVPD